MTSEENKTKYFNEAKKCIEANMLYFFQDVIAYLPIGSSAFYEYFPEGSDEHTELKRMLERNKIETKVGLRKQMYQIGNPTAMLALYKLIATPEEREALMKTTPPARTTAAVENNNTQVNVNVYQTIVTDMLKSANRYSPVMAPEVEALASAMATLSAANKIIDALPEPFVQETTTQGTKLVTHPAYALRTTALDNMAKHSKLLGIDYENIPEVSAEGPLAELTRSMIDVAKVSTGHMTVSTTPKRKRKVKKDETGKNKGRKAK